MVGWGSFELVAKYFWLPYKCGSVFSGKENA